MRWQHQRGSKRYLCTPARDEFCLTAEEPQRSAIRKPGLDFVKENSLVAAVPTLNNYTWASCS